jgi:RHS repeat-associated protein
VIKAPHGYLTIEKIVSEAGYAYIFLSNENPTQVDVYFDDLKVTHAKSPVVQADDYYPFGLAFNSYQRENSVDQNYLYNGKEKQDELDLDWLDYGARMYMPEIGRFMKIDSRAHNYMMYSPYGYVVNNPTNNIDYNGDFILPKEFLNRFQRIAQ